MIFMSLISVGCTGLTFVPIIASIFSIPKTWKKASGGSGFAAGGEC
jgi:hypothetical protein